MLVHQDDHLSFICAFYHDIHLFKKWATTAYNEHAQAPLTRALLTVHKHFLSTCGMLDDLDDPDNDKNPTVPRA